MFGVKSLARVLSRAAEPAVGEAGFGCTELGAERKTTVDQTPTRGLEAATPAKISSSNMPRPAISVPAVPRRRPRGRRLRFRSRARCSGLAGPICLAYSRAVIGRDLAPPSGSARTRNCNDEPPQATTRRVAARPSKRNLPEEVEEAGPVLPVVEAACDCLPR
jgi:hypothetical protein